MKKKIIFIVTLVAINVLLLLWYVTMKQPQTPVVEETLPTETEVVKLSVPKDVQDLYEKYHKISEDYVGQLYFESDLLNLPIVQGKTNEDYIRTDFETMKYLEEGTTFMDYRNQYESDKNIIIYGHYVYWDETSMFSPLHQLKEEDNYLSNKVIYFYTGNELRTYEIATVFYCQLVADDGENYIYTDPEMEYFHTEYTPEYWDTFWKRAKIEQFYDTGMELTSSDNILTLQTCVRNRDDLRLIVIAKEVNRQTGEVE